MHFQLRAHSREAQDDSAEKLMAVAEIRRKHNQIYTSKFEHEERVVDVEGRL